MEFMSIEDPATSNIKGHVAVGTRAVYDTIAEEYDASFRDELASKPLERGMLTAFLELVGQGTVADVGCGPGHVTTFLSHHHENVIGIDLSPRMIEIAQQHAPGVSFTVGSMVELAAEDASWAGVVLLYSIIHLTEAERVRAFAEIARVLRPDGWVLVSFHVDDAEFAAGETKHLRTWFGHDVELEGHFLQEADVASQLEAAGFTVMATLERGPIADIEYASRRCYLLGRRAVS
jgi:ubiquinone/menaquinone biosynthesis C-methylase UbiE